MITSELSKTYFQEEDAVKGFKIAVDNNQVRLAMQILTEIIDAFVEGFQVILEGQEQEVVKEESEVKAEQQKQPEKKSNNKKTESKEEVVKDAE
jgi:hypothetical protein